MCDLCELVDGDVHTKKYLETKRWIVVDCDTCNIPMAVYKEHTRAVPNKEIDFILDELKHLFPDRTPRWKMRKIPDHFHFHMEGK